MNLIKVQEESFGIIPLRQEGGIWYVLLILHQGGRHWAFPKGHGNVGETPIESARRELKEETGLEIEHLLPYAPLRETYQFHRPGEVVVKTVHYYPALVRGHLALQAEEIRAARWTPLKDSTRYLAFREAQEMCNQLATFLIEDGADHVLEKKS